LSLNDKPTLQDFLEVQQVFGLPSPALVEKDWYVVRALAAIAPLDTQPLRLVFGGGTALGRAHRLIQRMSEDVDLKIIASAPPPRPQLRALRGRVTTALLEAGFEFNPQDPAHRHSQNESRYTLFRLPYAPSAAGEGVLRPWIQIELALWPLLLPDVPLSVSSFVAEANKRPAEVAQISCVSVAQTVAEKFVALTRRIAAERNLKSPPDPTLVRHIYDLWAVRAHYDRDAAAALLPALMKSDAEAFGNQFPHYREDPIAATRAAIGALKGDSAHETRFKSFQRDMVYGKRAEFSAAMRELETVSKNIDGVALNAVPRSIQ
jgi:predicted nucleotidyltransferase component of viral defense system